MERDRAAQGGEAAAWEEQGTSTHRGKGQGTSPGTVRGGSKLRPETTIEEDKLSAIKENSKREFMSNICVGPHVGTALRRHSAGGIQSAVATLSYSVYTRASSSVNIINYMLLC